MNIEQQILQGLHHELTKQGLNPVLNTDTIIINANIETLIETGEITTYARTPANKRRQAYRMACCFTLNRHPIPLEDPLAIEKTIQLIKNLNQ